MYKKTIINPDYTVDHFQTILKDCLQEYSNILNEYSDNQKADSDLVYVKILEYAFFIGDKLAEQNYVFKEIEREQIINLQNKLVELFVHDKEVAWGIKNAREYSLNIKNFPLNSAGNFYNYKLLVETFYNSIFTSLEKAEKNRAFVKIISGLINPFLEENNNGVLGLKSIIVSPKITFKQWLFDVLIKIYKNYCAPENSIVPWSLFLTSEESRIKEITHDGEYFGSIRENEKRKYVNTFLYDIQKKYNLISPKED